MGLVGDGDHDEEGGGWDVHEEYSFWGITTSSRYQREGLGSHLVSVGMGFFWNMLLQSLACLTHYVTPTSTLPPPFNLTTWFLKRIFITKIISFSLMHTHFCNYFILTCKYTLQPIWTSTLNHKITFLNLSSVSTFFLYQYCLKMVYIIIINNPQQMCCIFWKWKCLI